MKSLGLVLILGLLWMPESLRAAPIPVELGEVKNATSEEVQMVRDAAALVERVVSSAEFRARVLDFAFTSTGSQSNAQIYERLTSGTMMIRVTMFTGSWIENHVWHTQGRDIGDGVVYANRYFIDDAHAMGSLILHEYAHQRGYHHESASESSSVPYAMNEIFESVVVHF